ncbi:glycosyltransferase family 39 protein [Mycobacterium sp. 852013-50091_SCH5140682]|uniref:ArnT family glycosyltransferase n=1 Tax=Mycobacterium sp. 852013-50091_SCH5140682 TaxID=1834109 RepID=UPI0009EEDD7D|nr:glycosyltransferase family 39 protein [Mycobacterium sp. 852013-50091_SCH5140682]
MPHVATAAPTRSVPKFAASAVLPIAAVAALAHCVATLLGRGYWFDEVYMLAIGRYHLDWGSADQPPAATALAALMDTVAPNSVFALRVPAILATAGAVVLAAMIAREFGGDRDAQAITAVMQATALWPTLTGHWLTPYTLEPVQWLAIMWLLVRWVRVRDDRLLVALGAVVGLAVMTKFQVLLLCAMLLVCIAITGPRDLLRRPALWLGAAIAIGVAAPTLWWQQSHGWPQWQMTRVVAGEAEALYGGRPGVAVQLVIYAGVLGVFLGLYGAWQLLRAPHWREYRFIAFTAAALYVVFIATLGRPYYLAGLYGVLAAAGAVSLQLRRAAKPGGRRWPARVGALTSIAAAVLILVFSVGATRSDIGEKIARTTAQAYQSLPGPEREHTALLGESYIVAAYLDGYAPKYSLPPAYSTNRSYGYFPPPPDAVDTVLYVGRTPEPLRGYFASADKVGTVNDDLYIYRLSGREQPWQQIWPRLRTLTVS